MVINVAPLPDFGFGHRALVWWATLGVIAIEGAMFALMIANYLYLKGRNSQWPPPEFRFQQPRPPRTRPTATRRPMSGSHGLCQRVGDTTGWPVGLASVERRRVPSMLLEPTSARAVTDPPFEGAGPMPSDSVRANDTVRTMSDQARR